MKTQIKPYLIVFIIAVTCGCRKEDTFKTATAEDASSLKIPKSFSKPNIIVMLADDIGYEIPTYTGGQSYSTPNLDLMAAGGTQFTQAHSAPLCSPSRFMLLTGKYNFRNYTTWGRMDTSQRTFANIAKSNGYTTCMAGKWQFNGGDASIHAFGFERYLVTNPYEFDYIDSGNLKFYKDPKVFENGAYWPASKTKGKYGDDLIRDYMFHYIDSVKTIKPFLIYWATNLVHQPFCPTPDDPEFASWNSNRGQKPGDTIYFKSMVKYEDKLLGQLFGKLQSAGIANNTIIIWAGDNGTDADISSIWRGQVVTGNKSTSNEGGTHVPMLAYCPGKVLPGFVDTSLISFVDFLPTVASLTNANIPASYGIIDGLNFAPQFSGDVANVRPWIFCHFIGAKTNEKNPLFTRRWMQNDTYKQYDVLPNTSFSKKFYNIRLDPKEKKQILPAKMTPSEKALSQQYLSKMATLH